MATVYSLLCENGQDAGSYFDMLPTSEKARYGSPGSYRCYGSIADWYNDREANTSSENYEVLEIADAFVDSVNNGLVISMPCQAVFITSSIDSRRTAAFHGGDPSTGYVLSSTASSSSKTAVNIYMFFCTIDGIHIRADQSHYSLRGADVGRGVGSRLDNCIISSSARESRGLSIASGAIVSNLLIYGFDVGIYLARYRDAFIFNCIIANNNTGFALEYGSNSIYHSLYNCLSYGNVKDNWGAYMPTGIRSALRCGGRRLTVTGETFTSAYNTAVALANGRIYSGSVSISGYAEGVDYSIDYNHGTVTVLSNGDMSDSTEYSIDYDHGEPWGNDYIDNLNDTDFVDFSEGDFRPAKLTSPQVDAGVTVLAMDDIDIGGNVRPNYSAGESAEDKWDVGCFEFDSGHGLAPINVRVKITALDVYDSTPINDAMVLLETDTGGPAPAGEDIIKALTGADGSIMNDQYLFSGDQPVTGRIRKASTPPYYKTAKISGTITASGLDLKIFMIRD